MARTRVLVGSHGPTTDGCWQRLWESLQALLRRSVRTVQDAEDIAAETLRRVLARFPEWPSWEDVWAWAARVARCIAISSWRKCGRLALEAPDRIDARPAPPPPGGPGESTQVLILDRLQPSLVPGDRETLGLLAAGISSRTQIAALRRVTVRSVKQSVSRIRSAAVSGNLCRPLHP